MISILIKQYSLHWRLELCLPGRKGVITGFMFTRLTLLSKGLSCPQPVQNLKDLQTFSCLTFV